VKWSATDSPDARPRLAAGTLARKSTIQITTQPSLVRHQRRLQDEDRALEFRILGSVEVAIGSQPLDVGGVRQSIMIATLLLSANKVVTMDRLLEAIYGENPPPTSRSQVQIGISSLRRLFAAYGHHDVISTHPNGYALHVGSAQLDAARFEELVAAARASEDPEQAVAKYRDALRLWRGPALHGIDRHPVQIAAGRLDELRVCIVEERIGIELDLGRHHELVGELTELVEDHPLRERFHGHLMHALHNCGRTAEALQVYRRVRDTLVDELGLDPGDELKQLHQAILRSDPTLKPPAEASQQVPRLLPSDIGDFTGREEQLTEIHRRLVRDFAEAPRAVPVVVLTGKGGVGKTAIAVHSSHRIAEHFSAGQLFVDLHGSSTRPVRPADVLERFIRALGVSAGQIPASLDERAETYRNLLAGRKVLITLDDAADESQVIPLVPGHGAAAIMVTSRGALTGIPGATHIDVDVFDVPRSVELLGRIAGTARVKAQPAAATVVAERCGHLPLALRIAGARLSARPNWSIQRLADRLDDETCRLDELRHRDIDIRAKISRSYEGADRQGRRLFRRLALLDTPIFSSWVSAPLLGQDQVRQSEDVLDDLVNAQLIEVTGNGRESHSQYRFHDLIRVFARERLAAEETKTEQTAALERALGALLQIADEASFRHSGRDDIRVHGAISRWVLPARLVSQLVEDPPAWFDHERAALVSGVRQAAAAGFVDLCWSLAYRMSPLFEAWTGRDDWSDILKISLDATREARNVRGHAAMLYSLGSFHIARRQFDLARLELIEAAQLFTALADEHGAALANRRLAVTRH
jgi:DNA-binding SARP family transcriptional activator